MGAKLTFLSTINYPINKIRKITSLIKEYDKEKNLLTQISMEEKRHLQTQPTSYNKQFQWFNYSKQP